MDFFFEYVFPYAIGAILFAVLGFVLLAVTSPLWYEPRSCTNKYGDAKYSFYGGCMVRYGSGYIPEELYQKQFIQNIGIEVK